ncbi:YdcF family protein [Crossiella sp. CA198]|uniref:YdcF family protein n=1 Tax=Crossiella sp. CA198 TaxID=3455607 RepID=UPI003F8D520F
MSDLSPQDRRDIELLWDFHLLDSGSVTADLLLVLGSHDLRVAEHAAGLYLDRAAPLAVVTGGAGKVTGGQWRETEAVRYARTMRARGVPADRILLEENSTNTGDNFDYSRKLVAGHGLSPASGIIVCKPYMARRALATAAVRWPELHWSARPPRGAVWAYPTAETPLDRMINLMVGDLQRLRVYAARGFQAPVEIPEPVWQAYERLAAGGFDQFVIRG